MSAQMLGERAVLMRFAVGLPGEEREDHRVSAEVKADKNLGQNAGKWEKRLFPKEALAAVKSKINEARAYHDTVTLPFDTGIGILPAALIQEYSDKMREFKGQIANLAETTFLAEPDKWIDWARREHNGTFEPDNYPGFDSAGNFNPEGFRSVMRKKFYVRTEPLPVPNAEHFATQVASLLGTDLESVDLRVADAAKEAQRELMKRLIAPVRHMVDTLAKDKPKIYETLIGNIADIVRLAPALNMSGDAEIDAMVQQMETLTRFSTKVLKDSSATRTEAKNAAQAMLDRLAGYKI